MYAFDSSPSLTSSVKARHEPLGVRAWIQGAFYVILLLAGLMAIMLTDTQSSTLKVGEVSPGDIRAPRRISYESNVRTQRAREAAASRVEAVYTPDRAQTIKQVNTAQAVAELITKIREDSSLTRAEQRQQIADIEPVNFDPQTIETILDLSKEEWDEVVNETRRLLQQTMRREIRENELTNIRRQLSYQIDMSLNQEQAAIVEAWVGALLRANSFLDEKRTQEARENARQSVSPVVVTYEPGQIIVREGEVVQPEHVEALERLGLQSATRSQEQIVGVSIIITLLIVVLSFYLIRVRPDIWGNARMMLTLLLTLVLATAVARVMMPGHDLLPYLTPMAAAAMLLSILLSADVALIASIILAALVFQLTGSSEFMVYTFVGGSIAALSLWRVERLHAFVRAGLLVGLANIGVMLAFALQEVTTPTMFRLALQSSTALANGVLSASLTLAGFYVMGSLAGATTFLQLMELSRPTHPLFRELLLKAPGTYHHSIVISNLAERAAETIGADPLLVRVAAYYHDIGKIHAPHYFVENQSGGTNPHDELEDPEESARLIINHVSDGVRLAKKHKLPQQIIDFIWQHHGTTRVEYFFRTACNDGGMQNVDESQFRYPGPRPKSREAAILMLADSVEAVSRAEHPTNVEAIDDLVCRIIAQKLNDGQLIDTDLTLRDLERVRATFVETLAGIYHARVQYPDAETRPSFTDVQPAADTMSNALPLNQESDDHPYEASGTTSDRPIMGPAG